MDPKQKKLAVNNTNLTIPKKKYFHLFSPIHRLFLFFFTGLIQMTKSRTTQDLKITFLRVNGEKAKEKNSFTLDLSK